MLTDAQFRYHRQHARVILPFGECSRMEDGRIKVEGYLPITDGEIYEFVQRNLQIGHDRASVISKLKALA